MRKISDCFMMLVVAIVIVSSFAPVRLVHAESEDELIAARKRIKELELQVAQLKMELADLKSREASSKTEATPKSTPVAAKAAMTEDELLPTKSYTTFAQFLEKMPADLRPNQKTGWDEVSFSKAKEWLERSVVGEKFEWKTTVRSAEVTRKTVHTTSGVVDGGWQARVGVDNEEQIKFSGQTFAVAVHVGDVYGQYRTLSLPGDERFKLKAEGIKPGQPAKVVGKISGVRVQRYSTSPKILVKLELTECDLQTMALSK